MTSKLIGIVALTAALVPGIGNAIGLGELTLQSRIGETLRAELPILATDEASPATACFSLVAMPGNDLPVITAAKTRLIRRGQTYVLQIVGSKPVNEPIFAIAVQAGCGHDVVRDFVLIPEPPLMQAEAEAQPSSGAYPVASNRATRTNEWQARDDASTKGIADAPPRKPSPPRAKLTSKPKPKIAPATKGMDQLRLGAAPVEARPGQKSISDGQVQADTEERLLKLETTLHLLAHEIEKMDQALALASKVIEAQGRLTLAQTLPAPPLPDAPTISAPPVTPNTPQSASWMELLISAALGAAISIGLAQYFGRRRRSPGEDQIPLALAAHSAPAHSGHPHSAPAPAKPEASRPAEKSAPPQTAGVLDITEDIAPPSMSKPLTQSLPEEIPAASAEPGIVDITAEDEYSVLELAEIMLAFGRVRGAADTLAEYVEQNLPKSIQPWSMLLDLYRRGGMREEFEALAEKMHSRFNTSIPAWSDSLTPISGLKALEDYPHIIQKASADWGSQACLDYLLGLISDTRAGLRNGFPLEVVEEIVLLMRVLEDGHGRKRTA